MLRLRDTVKVAAILVVVAVSGSLFSFAQDSGQLPPARGTSSYAPTIEQDFNSVMSKMSAAKSGIMQRQQTLLSERYDLSDHPVAGAKMSRGKAVQGGVRVKLESSVTWQELV